MACDGEIAQEELELVKQFTASSSYFKDLDIHRKLNDYVTEINTYGKQFLSDYLKSITASELDEQGEKDLAQIAIKIILGDRKIEYSEISFFKKIRLKLKLSDDALLEIFKNETLFEKYPEVQPEDFLLPDIMIDDTWDFNVTFDNITLQIQ